MVRYSNPKSLGEELKIALSVQGADKQEPFNESFYTKFDESVRISPRSSSPASSSNGGKQYSADAVGSDKRAVSEKEKKGNASRSASHGTRNAQVKTAVRCYNCDGVGHFTHDCPTRHKREAQPPIRPKKGIRADVRGVPETARGRESRQLFPPLRPQQCC
jgi:hypothetical protein